jgi:hypothetical protein
MLEVLYFLFFFLTLQMYSTEADLSPKLVPPSDVAVKKSPTEEDEEEIKRKKRFARMQRHMQRYVCFS